MKEAIALANGLRKWGPAFSGQIAILTDSLVLHGALEKTWSGCFDLNVQVRCILGNPRIEIVPFYIPTNHNPADPLSRSIEVAHADLERLVLRAFQALVAGVSGKEKDLLTPEDG